MDTVFSLSLHHCQAYCRRGWCIHKSICIVEITCNLAKASYGANQELRLSFHGLPRIAELCSKQ